MTFESLTLDQNQTDFSTLIILHDKSGDDFLEEMANSINNWDDAWREMLYCILAGTQVSTDIVRKSYFDLIESIPETLNFKTVKKSPTEMQQKIAITLKKRGYRFYETKSNTMINAANYFEEIVKTADNFRDADHADLRRSLIKNVKGIGNKISSHWLRNIGFQLPIIDIHVRRVLSCAGLIDDKYTKNQISDSEYWFLEKKIIEISDQMNINVAKLDFVLWIHGREYCVKKACKICPFGNNHV